MQTVFVRAGEPLLVREVGARWHRLPGTLEGAGVGSFLYLGRALGPGDLTLSASLTIHALAGSAASVVINWDSHLGFEGAGGEFFTSGPVFGNRFRALGPSASLAPTAPSRYRLSDAVASFPAPLTARPSPRGHSPRTSSS